MPPERGGGDHPVDQSGSALLTIAIAFSSLSLAIVRYFARFARSTTPIEVTTSGLPQDVDEPLDRLGQHLLGVDERVIAERFAGPAPAGPRRLRLVGLLGRVGLAAGPLLAVRVG